MELVRQKLKEIKLQYGEAALPLAKVNCMKTKWKAVAKLSILHKGFSPSYPDKLIISPRMFIELMPYHVVISSDLCVHQSGIRLQKLMPSIRNRNIPITTFMEIVYPTAVAMTFENLKKHSLCPFVLELIKTELVSEWRQLPALHLKGKDVIFEYFLGPSLIHRNCCCCSYFTSFSIVQAIADV